MKPFETNTLSTTLVYNGCEYKFGHSREIKHPKRQLANMGFHILYVQLANIACRCANVTLC